MKTYSDGPEAIAFLKTEMGRYRELLDKESRRIAQTKKEVEVELFQSKECLEGYRARLNKLRDEKYLLQQQLQRNNDT